MTNALLTLVLGMLGLILGALLVFAGMRLNAGRQVPVGKRPNRRGWLLIIVGWLMIFAGLLRIFAVVFGIILALILLIVLVMAFFRHRNVQKHTLLTMLATAAERGMPLVPVVEAFAAESRGILALSARRLGSLLKAGCPLPDALELSPGLVSGDAPAVIRVGYQSGLPAKALRDVVDAFRVRQSLWGQLSGKLFYFAFLMAWMFSVGSFMALKIMPAFEKIFVDFGTELPEMTQALMAFEHFILDYWYLVPLPLVLLVMVLVVLPVTRHGGAWFWNLPGCGPLLRRSHTAGILEALALMAERQLPIRDGIATLVQSYPTRSIRQRLAAALGCMDAGVHWAQCLARGDLIRHAELAVLVAAERAGNLPWALREMAASSRRRLAYRVQSLMQVFFVVVILTAGLMVAIFYLSYFLPLIQLIQSLA